MKRFIAKLVASTLYALLAFVLCAIALVVIPIAVFIDTDFFVHQ